jgi:predicted nucleotidyltransferase component of viral defense system
LNSAVLTPLQQALLGAFFRREGRFRLTGGGALAGFHLGHRRTEDLDLFSPDPVLDEGDRALEQAARELGASVERLQTSESFRRRLVRRGSEALVVDLVQDLAPHAPESELVLEGIRMDGPGEILANKLCALLSRSELRDLVDVRALEEAGHRVEDALATAHAKDGGLTPSQLAWVLSQWRIGEDARVPGGTSPEALRGWLAELCARLARMSWPGG